MQRLKDQRGTVSVIVAFLMVPLLAFAAVALDGANLWLQRRELQNGADAAALAIAQDCGRGSCGSTSSTAQTMVSRNLSPGSASTTVSLSSGKVRVVASTTAHDLFAPVLGVPSSQVSAGATATYGAPTGGTAVLPVAFSWCEISLQVAGGLLPSGTAERTIVFTKASATICLGPTLKLVAGGFGWVDPTAGCTSTAAIGQTLTSSTGLSVPSACTPADFAAVQNTTVLLPIFDTASGSGANASYHVYAYAAFTLTGYSFPGQYSWNSSGCGNNRCIKGYFTTYVVLSRDFTYGSSAPKLGASVAVLTA